MAIQRKVLGKEQPVIQDRYLMLSSFQLYVDNLRKKE